MPKCRILVDEQGATVVELLVLVSAVALLSYLAFLLFGDSYEAELDDTGQEVLAIHMVSGGPTASPGAPAGAAASSPSSTVAADSTGPVGGGTAALNAGGAPQPQPPQSPGEREEGPLYAGGQPQPSGEPVGSGGGESAPDRPWYLAATEAVLNFLVPPAHAGESQSPYPTSNEYITAPGAVAEDPDGWGAVRASTFALNERHEGWDFDNLRVVEIRHGNPADMEMDGAINLELLRALQREHPDENFVFTASNVPGTEVDAAGNITQTGLESREFNKHIGWRTGERGFDMHIGDDRPGGYGQTVSGGADVVDVLTFADEQVNIRRLKERWDPQRSEYWWEVQYNVTYQVPPPGE